MILFTSALTFFFVNLAPGGPASIMNMNATPEQREALTRAMGLDRPVLQRYADWLGAAAHGDLGTSLTTDLPVAALLGDRLPNTLLLSGVALLARSDRALADLPAALRARGFVVREVAAYRTVARPERDPADVRALLDAGAPVAIAVASPSAVEAIVGAVGRELAARATFLVSGPTTRRAVRESVGPDARIDTLEGER